MLKESQSELFIRLLGEALEAHRATREMYQSLHSKRSVDKNTRVYLSNLYHDAYSIHPIDCVELMTPGGHDNQNASFVTANYWN